MAEFEMFSGNLNLLGSMGNLASTRIQNEPAVCTLLMANLAYATQGNAPDRLAGKREIVRQMGAAYYNLPRMGVKGYRCKVTMEGQAGTRLRTVQFAFKDIQPENADYVPSCQEAR
jgi:hypothetical protein